MFNKIKGEDFFKMEKGYCMKCRAKRNMKNAKVFQKKYRKFLMGVCETCGTKVSKITK